MSLSRPATFPLLKLPFLCFEAVVKSWDIFDIIFFALNSKRTRQVMRNLNIPLIRIEVYLENYKHIMLGNSKKNWVFKNERETRTRFEEQYQDFSEYSLVLQKNAIPLYTRRTNDALKSYTYGNTMNALRMAMEFLNEVFNCSIETVNIYEDNFPLSGNIGVKSTENMCINTRSSQPFGYAQSKKLSLLLENLEVTDTCDFWMRNIERDFYVNPKLLKCRKLVFGARSAVWVTREILMKFEVPQLRFYYCPFSVEDILSFITNWFHSDNKELKYLLIYIQSTQFSLEKFQTEDLNPLPFSGRTRIPPIETYTVFDFSVGLEIVRHDGLVATIYVNNEVFLFHIWHSQ
ncbi:unnamed protein product [Caenorhabditis brenneri]